ncbi:hypothetical protein IW261DRAFT_1427464 [Armillaria novae-zelandiae]|uniref:Uncharacterized protein n=1 Tax=Armillaria novae-zelandiae TaxID=153914 RepID=A0AA39NBZ7_9AGAR|nr:hypothetical protein IW261DRAFT_1626967 [Armillaria novae-zelandiae]KAK0464101.1 hypothetical protein IW261DRAFT_1427464 [Armillaria novae-zelandiae]
MPALNACTQVASLVEASGIPYIEKLAKVTVAVLELLENSTLPSVWQRGKNQKDVKTLCESIANTVVVINTVVTMNEEVGAVCFKDICAEMEDGMKGFFKTNELQETIQDFRIRINDLKTDFMRDLTRLMAEIQNKEDSAPNREFVIRIATKHKQLFCSSLPILDPT